MPIKYRSGNMFDTDAEILINAVNCVGVMGKGLASIFNKRYPAMFKGYRDACARKEIKPGMLHVFNDSQSGKTIINFPTKRHWRQPSRFDDVEAGLIALRDYLEKHPGTKVAVPALGCGLGGLSWPKVKVAISRHLADLSCEISVFEPQPVENRQVNSNPIPAPAATAGAIAENKDTYTVNNQSFSLSPSVSKYPKRLIEVDLPIKRISAHARREKSIRHGHISTLHIWWARRPLAACRAVICAALWPDPADENCPLAFTEAAKREMLGWTSHERQLLLGVESQSRFNQARKNAKCFDNPLKLRQALLDFIADFANWDNSTKPEYLATARALTQTAHEALGGAPGTRPLVVDPFAGGGAIPLEALRVGADAFASDLNPVAVLLNKVVLEYIPKYGQRLADEVRKWGQWIKEQAEKELAEFYPKDPDGATPIAYLWARTIQCEGPGCGATIPLIRTNVLISKGKNPVFLKPVFSSTEPRISFQVTNITQPMFATIQGGKATCLICNYTTPNKNVMSQMIGRHGGSDDAVLTATVFDTPSVGRSYRVPEEPLRINPGVIAGLEWLATSGNEVPTITVNPNRPSPNARGLSAVTRYGMSEFCHLYSPRQRLALLTIRRLTQEVIDKAPKYIQEALGSCLCLAFGRLVDRNSTLCRWIPQTGGIGYTFGRQALGMIWDFVEINPLTHSGGWTGAIDDIAETLASTGSFDVSGKAEQFSATTHILPDDSGSAFVSDPPYYDAIPYADLSDFFYVWLRPIMAMIHPELSVNETTPKEEEAIWNPGRKLQSGQPKDTIFYESQMRSALREGRRITQLDGIGVVVFAHKSTAGWEALIAGMLHAGWIVTASWPIDTERAARTNAIGTASLASSVHLICRPRENPDGSVRNTEIGDWREVLAELPKRIHEWMPRLAEEGVVGADAIFACLGPALEVFSRYSRVEKASGEQVSLHDYLEQVWAAVSQEALHLVFEGADASGFEEDARLTAMWLWTISAGASGNDGVETAPEDEEEGESEGGGSKTKSGGYALEYDTARKIAQGLGAHLETLTTVIEVKGETARLLPVAERAKALFGKDQGDAPIERKQQSGQMFFSFFDEVKEDEPEYGWGNKEVTKVGGTVLDRIHQTMILFAAGRSEALRRFLVEEDVGRDGRFWTLAQSLSALYPAASNEKRWVDGVLARKKGLGF